MTEADRIVRRFGASVRALLRFYRHSRKRARARTISTTQVLRSLNSVYAAKKWLIPQERQTARFFEALEKWKPGETVRVRIKSGGY